MSPNASPTSESLQARLRSIIHSSLHLADTERAAGQLVYACHKASADAGWWTDPATGRDLIEMLRSPSQAESTLAHALICQKLLLIISEIIEGMEGLRTGKMDDKLPHRPMLEVELADAQVRIADLAGALDLDLAGALVEKLAYNRTRADHKIENRQAAGGKRF